MCASHLCVCVGKALSVCVHAHERERERERERHTEKERESVELLEPHHGLALTGRDRARFTVNKQRDSGSLATLAPLDFPAIGTKVSNQCLIEEEKRKKKRLLAPGRTAG